MLVAGLFVWFWVVTLGDGAVSKSWYWRRTAVVSVYALYLWWSTHGRPLVGLEFVANGIVTVHFLWMVIHVLYGDSRMSINDGR